MMMTSSRHQPTSQHTRRGNTRVASLTPFHRPSLAASCIVRPSSVSIFIFRTISISLLIYLGLAAMSQPSYLYGRVMQLQHRPCMTLTLLTPVQQKLSFFRSSRCSTDRLHRLHLVLVCSHLMCSFAGLHSDPPRSLSLSSPASLSLCALSIRFFPSSSSSSLCCCVSCRLVSSSFLLPVFPSTHPPQPLCAGGCASRLKPIGSTDLASLDSDAVSADATA
jgi:hypothetical protein